MDGDSMVDEWFRIQHLLLLAAVIALLSLTTIVHISNASVGYSMNVMVNNTTWSLTKSTQVLSFQLESSVKGNGNSSKYLSLKGLTNNNSLWENTYTREGNLTDQNRIDVKSTVDYIHIKEHVDADSNHYSAEINESMPTVVFSQDDFFFKGKQVFSRNRYVNDNTVLKTNYHGTKLLKTIDYAGTFTNSITFADLSTSSAATRSLKNESTALSLYSVSDQYSGLLYRSCKGTWDEDYFGLFNINRYILEKNVFHFDREEDAMGCVGGVS